MLPSPLGADPPVTSLPESRGGLLVHSARRAGSFPVAPPLPFEVVPAERRSDQLGKGVCGRGRHWDCVLSLDEVGASSLTDPGASPGKAFSWEFGSVQMVTDPKLLGGRSAGPGPHRLHAAPGGLARGSGRTPHPCCLSPGLTLIGVQGSPEHPQPSSGHGGIPGGSWRRCPGPSCCPLPFSPFASLSHSQECEMGLILSLRRGWDPGVLASSLVPELPSR